MLLLLLLLLPHAVSPHAFLTCPAPRQKRDSAPTGLAGTWHGNWVSLTVPGDLSVVFGRANAANLNAGIGGGPAGAAVERSEGHGLCGDVVEGSGRLGTSRRGGMFLGSHPQYGATASRGTFEAGGELTVQVQVTAYHGGWFEFRVCDETEAGADITQQCLSRRGPLKISPDTRRYPAGGAGLPGNSAVTGVLDYAGVAGGAKCPHPTGDAAFTDPLSDTPQTFWPSGSCCNGGGLCSDPAANDDRWVLPRPQSEPYEITLLLPEDLECEHCVLQWYYQAANSLGTYPEAFFNCADIEIKPKGSGGATGCVADEDVPDAGGAGGGYNGASCVTAGDCAESYACLYWAASPTTVTGLSGSCTYPVAGSVSGCCVGTDPKEDPAGGGGVVDGGPLAAWDSATTCPGVGSDCSAFRAALAAWCNVDDAASVAVQCGADRLDKADFPEGTEQHFGTCAASGPLKEASASCYYYVVTTPSSCVDLADQGSCEGDATCEWVTTTASPTPSSRPPVVVPTPPPTGAPTPATPPPPPPTTGRIAKILSRLSPDTGGPVLSNHWDHIKGSDAKKLQFLLSLTGSGAGSQPDSKWQGIINSVETAAAGKYPAFLNGADEDTNALELCAFLDIINYETDFIHDVEVLCAENDGKNRKCDYVDPTVPSVAGQQYYGRGPKQLSWNYNYLAFSLDYFGDDRLLSTPDLVRTDPEVMWASAMWFWMKDGKAGETNYGGFCPPQAVWACQETCTAWSVAGEPETVPTLPTTPATGCDCATAKAQGHWIPPGKLSPHNAIHEGRGGMPAVINIVNGGYDCCPTTTYGPLTSSARGHTKDRIVGFQQCSSYFGLSPGKDSPNTVGAAGDACPVLNANEPVSCPDCSCLECQGGGSVWHLPWSCAPTDACAAASPTPPPTAAPSPPPPTPAPAAAAPTATPAAAGGCVTSEQLVGINAESSWWPRCSASQDASKGAVDRSSYVWLVGMCDEEWVRELNAMLTSPNVDLCGAEACETRRRLLAQITAETAYFTTLGQPLDAGSGVIHMIPANWDVNADDMEAVFPGEGILAHYQSLGNDHELRSAFFKDPKYAWKSLAAWMKLTNRVIPGCGRDMLDGTASMDEMTRCILASIPAHRRAENYELVGRHVVCPAGLAAVAAGGVCRDRGGVGGGGGGMTTMAPTTDGAAAPAAGQGNSDSGGMAIGVGIGGILLLIALVAVAVLHRQRQRHQQGEKLQSPSSGESRRVEMGGGYGMKMKENPLGPPPRVKSTRSTGVEWSSWTEYIDEESGCSYWYDEVTKATQWEHPDVSCSKL